MLSSGGTPEQHCQAYSALKQHTKNSILQISLIARYPLGPPDLFTEDS